MREWPQDQHAFAVADGATAEDEPTLRVATVTVATVASVTVAAVVAVAAVVTAVNGDRDRGLPQGPPQPVLDEAAVRQQDLALERARGRRCH